MAAQRKVGRPLVKTLGNPGSPTAGDREREVHGMKTRRDVLVPFGTRLV